MKRRLRRIWNNYEIANEDAFGAPIRLEYGEWPWGERVIQRFTKEGAQKIADDLKEKIAAGEPGIPVYQGHPDVPELAAQYPDKGALGWIKAIKVEDEYCELDIEWDRYPGKGFCWMSPYWGGPDTLMDDGKILLEVEELQSIGLTNNPNIKDFRLPNEEAGENEKTKGVINMNIEELLKLLGFADGATPEEIKAKCQELVNALADKKAAELNAQNACAEAEKKANEATQKLEAETAAHGETKTALANEKAEVERMKTELANSKAELEKIKSLKTVSVTMQLANQEKATQSRMQLVNQVMADKKLDFDSAWAEAKAQKPELFK